MTLLLMYPGSQNQIGAALIKSKSALFNLRSSSGYKRAKRDNPNPLAFAKTFSGRCEHDLEAVIQFLGGTP